MNDMPADEQNSIRDQVAERESRYTVEQALRALEWGHCGMAEMGGEFTETTLAIAQDGSDYVADLETSYRFGCVQFEQCS